MVRVRKCFSTELDEIISYPIGQLDPAVYISGLQDENTKLKARVQSLVEELVTLENQRGGSLKLIPMTGITKEIFAFSFSKTTI